MSDRVHLNPEQIESIARQFMQGKERTRQISSDLALTVQNLEQEWEGVSKQRFMQDFQEADRQMRALVHTLEAIGLELSALAHKFRTIDQTR
ncbi:WXG100 family type VII secretion target [Paenibacillus sp. CAA11]|uniref:WXG100 family type VII secretion target n=1 Tax=Paenibacillus sp. CAA11 TaxID=1532905 RepID=UPI000D3791D8|nr:WXG100 family type VII secretion target [Paenibacillus sp. CAA11]AWB44414.1 WXG100 family type VII secretion target [Paenibacillus sp. CAA11]